MIRNLAIIAHVDHGKTTLIDGLFKESGLFKKHQATHERVMDSGDLEKEKGITITAKNAAFKYKDHQINIVDTPGHADFGGEVERALFMVDGALLLVDASEGPLPQTRFVLKKALDKNLKIIVIINKVDRPDARIDEVEEKVLELFYDLATDDSQIDYKTIYASSKEGWASLEKNVKKNNFIDLLDTILEEIPAPKVSLDKPFSMLIANRTYNSFLGEIAVGRIESGSVSVNEEVVIIDESHKITKFQVTSLERFSGLSTQKENSLSAGNIALIAGSTSPQIGDTISNKLIPKALPRLNVDLPTVSVRISVNTSPLAGKEGKYATSRKIEELLKRACTTNVSLRYEMSDDPKVFILKARGELQLVILLEEFRREGYEMMVGRPEVIPIEIDGDKKEPIEDMTIDIPDTMIGTVSEILSPRGGVMKSMEKMEGTSRARLNFRIPTRGLIGLRSTMLTETRGEAIYSSSLDGYIPYEGKRFSRQNGAIVCDRNGSSSTYALFSLQSRGKLFINSGEPVYEGMIFGENNRQNDLNANPTKEKKLTNIRASGKDEALKLKPIKPLTLEEAIEWIDEDEWVEVTPKKIRLRKAQLENNLRNVIRR